MSDKKFTIKFKKEVKAKKNGKDEKTFIVRTKGEKEQTVTFKKDAKENDESENTVELEYKEKEESDDKFKPLNHKFKYKKSFFTEGVELGTKKLGTDYELNEELRPSVGIFKSWNWPIYLIIVVVILGLVGLIWWWVASSRSEDKEEEGL